jgi:phage/plasmid-associated DNA primase
MLNDDLAEQTRVFEVIAGWLDSDEEAESLLSHLATSLAPGWSAVKYVLLLGEGRNGKSVLLKMLKGLFGSYNISSVTRQMMSEQKAPVMSLNGKLLNLVFDGSNEYIKDSGTEKSLVAGEPVWIEAKYKNTPVEVQFLGLPIEALNREPKTHDKSAALQKRLVRFHFPNVYALDHRFERSMLTEESLGAFLALLIKRYVKEDDVAARLAPTSKSLELQLEQMYSNSLGLQFLKYIEETDTLGADGLVGKSIEELVQLFRSWRLKENDLGTWADPDVAALFQPLLNTERKSDRNNPTGQPRKVRKITSFKHEAVAFIESLKGDDDDAALLNALVED